MIPTSSQTIGPFWHALATPELADLTRSGGSGVPVVLAGRVIDGDAASVTDACVELWQASPRAVWGRCATDARGEFRFVTVAPEPRAPFLSVVVLARGLLRPLWTRVYLGEPPDDALLASLGPRRATLVAQPSPDGWRWDVRLRGGDETVFFVF